MNTLRRTLPFETKVLDSDKGLMEYVASDETIDHAKEIVAASGWRFTHFRKNAPFVDSHDYSSINKVLGRITDWRVEDKQLILTAQWAKDIPGSLAEMGWRMASAGFLKAVSVGFWPEKMVSRWDPEPGPFRAALKRAGRTEEDGVNVIYLQQELVELSACVLGCNPNAVARAYHAGVLKDADLEAYSRHFSLSEAMRNSAAGAQSDDAPAASPRRARSALMIGLQATAASLAAK